VAKKFENGRGTRGLEKSKMKRALRTERLLSVLRQASCATEAGNWLMATHQARKNAQMPGRWTDGVAAKQKVIFVLWAEPAVFFRKEIRILCESNRVGKASVNTDTVLGF
jgi:hypothetical protein